MWSITHTIFGDIGKCYEWSRASIQAKHKCKLWDKATVFESSDKLGTQNYHHKFQENF